MGLLNNPTTRRKLVSAISKYNNKLSFLSYVAGLVWFLALAYRPFNAGTYFSENALLPGLVEASFYHDHGAGDFYRELKEEYKALKAKDSHQEQNSHRIPAAWLEKKFQDLGLDTYVQNFTFHYPEGILKDQKFQGQNVYGILRAPRASSTEAVVMTAPYRTPDSPGDKTTGGIALMLGLAKAFRKHTYWAKDIVFLVTEYEQIGMQAWLSAYHHAPTKFIQAGELHGRSGSIQAAVNLEIPHDSVSKFNIKLEGLNGQLPNLDLVNTVVRLCKREKMVPSLHKRNDYWNQESWEGFEHTLQTMLLMMWHQAPGIPTGNHGLFLRYHIEAVTLQGIKLKNNKKNFGFQEMGRVVEGVFRSLNNLLERFHQSFFFYLLPSTDRYVSIGLYMPPFGALALPIVIKALALWISYGAKNAEEEEEEQKDHEETEAKQAQGDTAEPQDGETPAQTTEPPPATPTSSRPKTTDPGFLALLPTIILALFFGMLAYTTPKFFVDTGDAFRMGAHEGMAVGAGAIFLAAIFFPYMLKRKSAQKGKVRGADWQLLKCMGLLAAGVVLSGTALMNISLAFFVSALWVPILVLVRPSCNRLFNLLQYLLLIAASPAGMLFIGSIIQNAAVAKTHTDPLQLLSVSTQTASQGLLMAVIDMHMFGNWMYSLVSLAMFPIWLIFWALLWTEPY